MIGDKICITEKSQQNARLIYKHLGNKNIVLIGGVSGSQKSESAECLQEILLEKGKQSILFSMDDYYLVAKSIRDINRKKQGIESVGLKEIDFEMIFRVIDDFQNNKPIRFQRYHRYCDLIEHNVLTSDVEYIIFEGLFANYIRKTYLGNLSVYLDGSPSQTLEFRKMRGKENANDEWRQQIVQREFNTCVQLKKYADIIIPYEN